MSYQGYLNSEHWRRTRNAFGGGKMKRRCFLCHSKENIVVHHKRYDNLGFEKRADLRYLCETCHNKIHKYKLEDILKSMPVKRVVLRNWLKKLK